MADMTFNWAYIAQPCDSVNETSISPANRFGDNYYFEVIIDTSKINIG